MQYECSTDFPYFFTTRIPVVAPSRFSISARVSDHQAGIEREEFFPGDLHSTTTLSP